MADVDPTMTADKLKSRFPPRKLHKFPSLGSRLSLARKGSEVA